ncbi:hypothetical protein CA85_45530 [Allorhodopirellula solitaria]|uniref:Uncharacterized protein n=1 Tax=Allorhodopirellula solitaria TaxID=2527987 RepID=A0A5C5WZS8_9BACT|nr:hypothetical protein CA85_45530 [Allorhodopirellula solitaria]
MNKTSARWCPRFSLRFVLTIPLLLAVYLACGVATKTSGVDDVTNYLSLLDSDVAFPEAAFVSTKLKEFGPPEYYLPFVLERVTVVGEPFGNTVTTDRSYYAWVFGHVYQLPVTRRFADRRTATRTFSMILDERTRQRGF